MNIFAISSIFVLFANLFMGIITLLKSKNRASKIFCIFTFSIVIWAFGSYKFSTTSDKDIALFWWQVAYTGPIFAPILFLSFILRFLALRKKWLIIFLYIAGFVILFFNWYGKSKYFLGDLSLVFNQFYCIDWIKSKNVLWLMFYFLFCWLVLLYAFILLIRAYKSSKDNFRNQLKYFILGATISWFGTQPLYLMAFRLNIYPYSNFLLGVYPFIISYAILKYRLLDIKVAITRTGIFIAIYSIVLGLPFVLATTLKVWIVDLLGPSWWMAPFGLLAALATIGPFIYIFVSRRAEEKLFKEQKRYQDTLKHASIGMTRIRELKRLLSLIAHIVTKVVKISYVAIYLYNEDTDEYILQVNRDHQRTFLQKLKADNPLISWIMLKREPVVYEEIKHQMEDSNDFTHKLLEGNMKLLAASVLIPIFLEDRFMGFVVLGDKVSGQIYTPEDLNVFQVLASQAALAIENAQFYEEAKEMQGQIAQAEKMATIGTMADGLSHQINNRFYALSLIAGDTIDTIKMADTSKCTPEVKEMIEQINHALERIQSNVMQGGEVVKGILKYTRKGDEKFEALSLDQIIDGTIEMVQFKVKLSEFDLVRNYTKDTPRVRGNLTQLEEVFFNFIDNAYDSIVERSSALKEAGFRGQIVFSAQKQDGTLKIIIEDNGLGVKDENIKKIFTPFFTTKISARKGTGLGLYVIKKIIEDTHKGKIFFESKYQKGTRFVVELPIAA